MFELDQSEFLQTQAGQDEPAGRKGSAECSLDDVVWQHPMSVFRGCREQNEVEPDLVTSDEGADTAFIQCIDDG